MVGNHTCSRSPRPRLLFATSSWKLGFLRHWKPRAWGMGGERMVVSWDAKLGCLGTWRKDGSLSTENALSLCLEPGIFGAELGSGANRLRHLTMPIHSSPRVAKSEDHGIAWEFGSCFGVITVSIYKGKAWCQDWKLLYLAAALVSCIHAFSFALSQHTPRPTGEIEWEIGSSFQHLSNKAIWWGVQLFLGGCICIPKSASCLINRLKEVPKSVHGWKDSLQMIYQAICMSWPQNNVASKKGKDWPFQGIRLWIGFSVAVGRL